MRTLLALGLVLATTIAGAQDSPAITPVTPTAHALDGGRGLLNGYPWSWNTVTAQAERPDETANSERLSEVRGGDAWGFRLSVYGWLPSINGETKVRGTESDVGVSQSEVLDSFDIGFFTRLLAKRGRFFVMAEATYSNLSSEEEVGIVEIDAEIEYGVFDFAAGYTIYERSTGDSPHEFLDVAVHGGARVQYMKLSLDTQLTSRASASTDWAELLLGAQLRFGLSELASAAVSLDFSGFDIGTGSTLTWNFWGALSYRLSQKTHLFLGYRLLGLDYARNSGADSFAADFVMNGPVAGINIDF